jgi:Ca2+-binding RTX toxin-like protein
VVDNVVTPILVTDPITGIAAPDALLGDEGTDTLSNIEIIRFTNRDANGVAIPNSFTDVFIAPRPATGSPAIVDANGGTPTEGEGLSATTAGIADPNGIAGAFSFQWQVAPVGTAPNGVWTDIAGATASTFTPAQAQVGQILRVAVSFTDGIGTLERVISAPTSGVGDLFTGGAGADTPVLTPFDDVASGNGGADTLNGLAGNDTLNGNGGGDILNGGDGIDTISGGAGNDVLNGDAGNDTLNGNADNDVITGGAGDDTINGGTETDTAVYVGPVTNLVIGGTPATLTVADTLGGQGIDSLVGVEVLRIDGTNYTIVAGTGGADASLNGGNGSQALFGFGGADVLNGGGGSDILNGGAGADTVDGGGGDDFIFQSSTEGRDFVDGGAGSDTYILTGDASVEDFTIMTRAAAIAGGIAVGNLNATTEIVITRNGTNFASVIAQLDNIEEIKINTLLTTANNGNGVVDGGATQGDTVTVVGNFNAPFTSLAFNTIRIEGSKGNDTINISGLTSAHRVVFNSNGGADTIVGTARPQDVIAGVQGFSGSDVQQRVGAAGVESNLQLMELTNRPSVSATNRLADHFATMQSGRETIDIARHADLFLNRHDFLSGLTSARSELFNSFGRADTAIGTIGSQDAIIGIPGVSAIDLQHRVGAGLESDFQLMELVNHTTMSATNDVVDHFARLQSGHEMIGVDFAGHTDLFLSSHDLLSGLDRTGPGNPQTAAGNLLLQL